MDPLDLVRSRNRADIELPSGLGATIRRVRIQDAAFTGAIPLPILEELDQFGPQNGHKPEDKPDLVSPAALAAGQTIQRERVRRSLLRLAPSVAELKDLPELDMSADVIAELEEDDFDLLASYARGAVPFPVASPST